MGIKQKINKKNELNIKNDSIISDSLYKSPGGWRDNVDLNQFKADIDQIGSTLRKNQGVADYVHLQKMLLWTRCCFYGGIILCALTPLISIKWLEIISYLTGIFFISCGINSRWTMIAHHVCHGGYDSLKVKPYHRKTFALGFKRRMIDWLDWMLPEAWNVEHNNCHHYQLGEKADPDLVEDNLWYLRVSDINIVFKYLIIGFFMLTWKWFYYAPNTYKELKLAQQKVKKDNKKQRSRIMTLYSLLDGSSDSQYCIDFLVYSVAPYVIYNYVLLPLPLYYFCNRIIYLSVFKALLYAELITNIHSFIVIVTNHAGDDLYRFDSSVMPKTGEFYMRQVIGSADFRTGSDLNDFLHGYLNYQIEHHIWPDLSMLSYQKSQPLIKALCKKHGIPYVQQSVFKRLKKTVDIMVGKTSMKRWEIDA